MYVAQLLPDEMQARLIRKALVALAENPETTTEESDALWEIIAKLTSDMRQHNRRNRGLR